MASAIYEYLRLQNSYRNEVKHCIKQVSGKVTESNNCTKTTEPINKQIRLQPRIQKHIELTMLHKPKIVRHYTQL